jgi:opacity protein-like surface antigen
MRLHLLAAAALLAAAPLASAKNPARGWYVGLDVGSSELSGQIVDNDEDAEISLNDNARTFTAHAGYRFNRFLQLGAFYSDFGTYSVGESGYQLDADLRGVGIQFTGRVPLGEKFGLIGYVAAMHRRLDLTMEAPGGEPESDFHGGIHPRVGFGVNYLFSPQWDIRLEYAHSSSVGAEFPYLNFPDRFDLDADLDSFTLGFRYKH